MLPTDDIDINVVRVPCQLVHDGTEHDLLPARAPWLADNNFGDIAGARIVQELFADILAAQGHGFRPQLLGQAEGVHYPVAVGFGQPQVGRGLNIDSQPFRPQPRRHAPGRPYQPGRERTGADAHQHALGRRPCLRNRVRRPVDLHLGVDPVSRTAQGQFPQGNQIAFAEEVVEGPSGLLRHIDLALAQTLQQLIGGQVDQFNLIGLIQDGVGHGFTDEHARDLGHDIIQALQVLHIDRGVDIDTGVEQLLDILPAFGVP